MIQQADAYLRQSKDELERAKHSEPNSYLRLLLLQFAAEKAVKSYCFAVKAEPAATHNTPVLVTKLRRVAQLKNKTLELEVNRLFSGPVVNSLEYLFSRTPSGTKDMVNTEYPFVQSGNWLSPSVYDWATDLSRLSVHIGDILASIERIQIGAQKRISVLKI